MHPISTFGMIHTVISIIAVFAAIIAFVRDHKINPANSVGKTYILFTVLSCVTSFFIFHDTGHFGAPHALGIITLVVLGIARYAGTGKFGTASKPVETICYSLTFFFHMVPTVTEGLTRLPVGHPIAATQQDPHIMLGVGLALFLTLMGIKMQLKYLRKERQAAAMQSGK